MNPAAHQIIHQVIAGGDAAEDAVNEARLLVLADLAETEISLRWVAACAGALHICKIAHRKPARQMTALS